MDRVTEELKKAIDKIVPKYKTSYIECSACNGEGITPYTCKTCKKCDGSGKVLVVLER
jgi:DnaJ-class molecular chaperone